MSKRLKKGVYKAKPGKENSPAMRKIKARMRNAAAEAIKEKGGE